MRPCERANALRQKLVRDGVIRQASSWVSTCPATPEGVQGSVVNLPCHCDESCLLSLMAKQVQAEARLQIKTAIAGKSCRSYEGEGCGQLEGMQFLATGWTEDLMRLTPEL